MKREEKWYINKNMPGFGGICISRRPESDYWFDGHVAIIGDYPIAQVLEGDSGWVNKFNAESNAKLIAAAPIGFENHVINSGHCDSLIEMIEDGRIEAAKRLIASMKDNCEYSIKKATE